MSLRKPIVLVGGQLQQLQSGDTLDAPTDQAQMQVLSNDNVGSLAPGTPVYVTAADHCDKAKADAVGTTKCVGLAAVTIGNGAAGAVAVGGVLALSTGQWDTAFGTSGGLAFGVTYYLSAATAGLGTLTAPATVGQYVVELGLAISTTELLLRVGDPILL